MFWKSIGRWALVAIAIPLAAAAVRKLGERAEARNGSTRFTRALGRTASGLDVISGRDRRAVSH